MDKIGRYVFVGGVVVALLSGFISSSWVFPVLTVLGLIVGFMNVTATEVQPFLLAAVSLVIIAALGSDRITDLPGVGETIGHLYTALLVFVSPAALIVALKAMVGIARS